jgi:hypothetical protein
LKTLALLCAACAIVMGCAAPTMTTTRPTASPLLSCGPAIRGLDAIPSGGVALFGEMHGTSEIPRTFGEIACQLVARGDAAVTVGLEIPESEQPRIDAFMSSDGGAAARGALQASSFWTRPGTAQDGRSSAAMLELLDRLRALRRTAPSLRVATFDLREITARTGDGIDWDGEMANRLEAIRHENPSATLLVLTGNVHARTAVGTPWDASFVPMGRHLADALPGLLAFNAAFAAGEAWVCLREGECGPSPMRGKDLGGAPFLERHATKSPEGYDGIFYVGGAIHASPPSWGR